MFIRSTVAAQLTFGSVVGLAMLAAGCGSSPPSPTPPPGGSLVTVFITNNVYSPNPLNVRVGQMVNWKNNDSIIHTATMDGGFNTGNIPPLSAHDNPVTFSAVGTFTYHCVIHPSMVGTIVVRP